MGSALSLDVQYQKRASVPYVREPPRLVRQVTNSSSPTFRALLQRLHAENLPCSAQLQPSVQQIETLAASSANKVQLRTYILAGESREALHVRVAKKDELVGVVVLVNQGYAAVGNNLELARRAVNPNRCLIKLFCAKPAFTTFIIHDTMHAVFKELQRNTALKPLACEILQIEANFSEVQQLQRAGFQFSLDGEPGDPRITSSTLNSPLAAVQALKSVLMSPDKVAQTAVQASDVLARGIVMSWKVKQVPDAFMLPDFNNQNVYADY
jgi:hypothetical protein